MRNGELTLHCALKGRPMKYPASLTLAVLIGGLQLANGQTTPGASGQSGATNPPTQCWDVAANQVRTSTEPAATKSREMPETTVGEGSSEGMSAIVPGTKGTASKNLPGSSGDPTGSSGRPPGMPSC
jgi:hypothetical protein